jgi:hypothetical protein
VRDHVRWEGPAFGVVVGVVRTHGIVRCIGTQYATTPPPTQYR